MFIVRINSYVQSTASERQAALSIEVLKVLSTMEKKSFFKNRIIIDYRVFIVWRSDMGLL